MLQNPSSHQSNIEVQRVPWSVIGPEFIQTWGRSNPKNPQPEHLEVIGVNGSGKSFLLSQILAEMVRRRKASVIFIATKAADSNFSDMGWPIVDTWDEVTKNPQCIFWPSTGLKGTKRKEYQEQKIQELLDNLWGEQANTIVVFDEFAYIEGLSRNMKDTLNMYLREGRSHGITCVMGKQRGQGVQRDMHSESVWKICFKLTDRKDMEYVAELFGDKRDYIPVLQSLDKQKHEFLIQNKNDETTYISWVDQPVSTRLPKKKKDFYE